MATRTVWRLTQRNYADDAFTGEGARRFGGRFNRPGMRVVYAAESLALALVETLVGLADYEELYRYVFFRIDLAERHVETLPREPLPAGWDALPLTESSRQIGDTWAEQKRSLAPRVPSAVVPYSFNYVLNPEHSAFDEMHVHEAEALPVDPRLVRTGP